MDILYLLLGSIITVIMYNLYNYWDAYERKRRDKKFEKSMDTIESMLKSEVIKHVFEFCGEDSKISKHMNNYIDGMCTTLRNSNIGKNE